MGTEYTDPGNAAEDCELQDVATNLLALDPEGKRWASVLRHTYDVVYNGQETGRFSWEQLMKTEKTHFGTLFEIFAQREFQFENGDATDYRIAGVEVDAKWSQRLGGWMLPPEVVGHIALVATGDDQTGRWSLGLVRVHESVRSEGSNRDKKSTLNSFGRSSIRWLWKDAPLPNNVLLQLSRDEVDRMLKIAGGVNRIAQLFRLAEGQVVGRSAVLTVAQQLDAMRRLRGGSNGARQLLAPEGYLILSGTYHQAIAGRLGLPVPASDEFVAHRVLPDPNSGVFIAGQRWRIAARDEPIRAAAPIVPMKWEDMAHLSGSP
ncbi:restriction endonuclease [Curtobacterium sp. VKM Ac-2889]|uniref:NaeI family type II restriction endonuclease n=1 Tax=unclassified Curtobacterium TaxID=257496 RepID=UPI00188BF130|nr:MULTISPECIES: NaeI family type II restriction endonuclease [unclassified Curtobacterium]MBF4597932.1 restriction endonuclease [Curtobacterium sp. VKM Ac-1796]MBF4612164.1 restriction endonuclease [Curtobacterium sp. VKM Ac-2889]